MAYIKIPVDTTTGDVTGPASSTNTAIALFDGTTGKLLKNSVVTIDGSGNVAGVNSIAFAGLTQGSVIFVGSGGFLSQNNSMFYWDDTNAFLSLGAGTSPAARLQLGGNRSAPSWTTAGVGIRTDAAISTNTTSSGTVAVQTQHGFAQPTFAATSSTTVTDAATWYIANAPAAGTNMTLTRAWAQYIAAGQLYIADGLRVGTNSQTATIRFASTMTGTNAAANAIYGTGAVNMTSATSVQSSALTGDNSISGNQNNNNSTGMTGVEGITRSSNTATVTSLIGVKATGVNSGAGTVTNLYNMRAFNAINSGGGTITSLYGFYSDDLTTGTNNYGAYLNVSSGTNKWNLYGNGTAANYLNGDFRVGTTTATSSAKVSFVTTGTNAATICGYSTTTHTVNSTGSYSSYAHATNCATVMSGSADNTSSTGAVGLLGIAAVSGSGTGTITGVLGAQVAVTNSSSGIVSTAYGVRATGFSNSGSGSITNVVCFNADGQTAGGTLNIGFRGLLAAAATAWNTYMSGTASNYFEGSVGVGTTTVTAKANILSTTEQLRVLYDTSNYYSTTVSSAGLVSLDAAGTGAGFNFLDRVIIPTATPASAAATGTTGHIAWDSGFLYVCTATNTWKRVAIATW